MTTSDTHNAPEFKHAADMEWEMGRFGNVTKFLFHPRPERPTEPNAGFLKYAPGASFPLYRHDFAQTWHIIEGEFHFCRKVLRPWHDGLYARRGTSSVKCIRRPAGPSSLYNIRGRPRVCLRSMMAV